MFVCYFCNETSGAGYHCKECSLVAHEACVNSLNKPSPCKHSLMIYSRGSLDYSDGRCHFCKDNLLDAFFFHCSICNISVDEKCMKSPQQRPLTLRNPKTHEHTLILLARLVIFTCNGCGLEGDRNPYVCVECNYMMHKDCVHLPRVICINRHDHRISRTSHLGYGDWECGVCRQQIDWVYGASTCSRCPSYAVHSKCATRNDVWDGKELEDEPEEEVVEPPFVEINEKEIIHFSHQHHHLHLHEDDHVTGYKNDIRCICCVLPMNDDSFYGCADCDFNLHKACASFPRRKVHFLHNHKLILPAAYSEEDIFNCSACHQYSNGFRYGCYEWKSPKSSDNDLFDVRCVSISEPFHHELHPHPLYSISTKAATCRGCDTYSSFVLNCTSCDEYALCMKCATLPRKVKNRCDDHFLSLCHEAGNASGDLWCDICERKTDPCVWYYTCDKCGTSLHVNCVLGDYYYLKTGSFGHHPNLDIQIDIVPNKSVSRPLCCGCKDRCRTPFLLKYTSEAITQYYCSVRCSRS